MDDYSRYIIAYRLAPTMAATDVEHTLTVALEQTGVAHVQVKHRPRLLSDKGPAFITDALADFRRPYDIRQIHERAHHPQTQGKIEHYHRSMKSIVKLNTFYFPWELEQAIADFVAYYSHERYHESLDNVTPADMYFGRHEEVLTQRDLTKQRTLLERRKLNLRTELHAVWFGQPICRTHPHRCENVSPTTTACL